MKQDSVVYILLFFFLISCNTKENVRSRIDFNEDWKIQFGDNELASRTDFDDSAWRNLNLPHDWSIEGEFSEENPTKVNGGALPAGIGWYRKSFQLDPSLKNKQLYIDFDGVYRNSEVWINGQFLGKRAFGYASFRYDLTPFLNSGDKPNLLAVRVDNNTQPNSRWYTGSGIYRNVWLVATSDVHIDHWGTFVTTPEVSGESATVNIDLKIRNKTKQKQEVQVETELFDASGKKIATAKSGQLQIDSLVSLNQQFQVKSPELWSIENPALYKAVTSVFANGKLTDQYETPFGIRYFK
ncbi:MAG: beta galactosidase jelly roll domain-containing protein, partial [Bacteroidota bacterium]|nr:beta galactosidase jelly roll domain-containing protein [Bacteroidota bacterium]